MRWLAVFAVLLEVVGSGCFTPVEQGQPKDGGANAGAIDSGVAHDAGVPDAGEPDAGPLWPVGATQVKAGSHGGFGLFTCAVDGGVVEGSDWTLALPSGELSFVRCVVPDVFRGTRTLDAGALSRFDAAMRGLTRTSTLPCGADKPDLVLLLTTDAGVLRYEDDFYACSQTAGTVYVGHIDAVFSLLEELSQ
jgi:hypothetical protein